MEDIVSSEQIISSKRLSDAITAKLQSLLKINDVEILTEYVWHMLSNRNANHAYMCQELKEFLGDQVEPFVDWVFSLVIDKGSSQALREDFIPTPQPAEFESTTTKSTSSNVRTLLQQSSERESRSDNLKREGNVIGATKSELLSEDTAAARADGVKRESRRERLFSLAVFEATQQNSGSYSLKRNNASRRVESSDALKESDAKRRKSKSLNESEANAPAVAHPISNFVSHQMGEGAKLERRSVILKERGDRPQGLTTEAINGKDSHADGLADESKGISAKRRVELTESPLVEEVKAVLTPNPRFFTNQMSAFAGAPAAVTSKTAVNTAPVLLTPSDAVPSASRYNIATEHTNSADIYGLKHHGGMETYGADLNNYYWTDSRNAMVHESYPSEAQPHTPRVPKVKKRCAKWPSCPFGEQCHFIHPSEKCENWPNCTFGVECFYVHPDVACRYGVRCLNPYCNFSHPQSDFKNAIGGKTTNKGLFKNKTLLFSTTDGEEQNNEKSMDTSSANDFHSQIEKISTTMPSTPPSLKASSPYPNLLEAGQGATDSNVNELPQLQL